MKIIALVGSIRRSSYNRKLATFVQKRYADQLDVTIPNLGALPFYDQDIELEAPAEVQAFKQTVMDADGVIFVTRNITIVFQVSWKMRLIGYRVLNDR